MGGNIKKTGELCNFNSSVSKYTCLWVLAGGYGLIIGPDETHLDL